MRVAAGQHLFLVCIISVIPVVAFRAAHATAPSLRTLNKFPVFFLTSFLPPDLEDRAKSVLLKGVGLGGCFCFFLWGFFGGVFLVCFFVVFFFFCWGFLVFLFLLWFLVGGWCGFCFFLVVFRRGGLL